MGQAREPQSTGSFKIRGGLNLVAQMSDEEKRRGVICASTGNHGQSVALACRLHGVRCRIVVPAGNNPDKNAAMRALGAEVVEHGRDFDEAREYVEALSAREGWRYVHTANEPQLIAGVATYALEVFEECPDLDYIFVPIGGGSGAAGCAIVRSAHRRARQGDRRAGRARRCVRTIMARTGACGRARRYLCRGDRHANDIRSDVLHPQDLTRRRRDAGGVGARGRPVSVDQVYA